MADQVLVTGGTGYIGSHTCVELLAAGYSVVIADNLSNSSAAVVERIAKIAGRRPEFHRLDVRDSTALSTLFASQAFDAVLHFAGVKAVAESVADPLKYYSNNVCGSLTLFETALRHGVRSVVFSSSATVYGESARSPIREDAATAPANPYGWSKCMVEQQLSDLCTANRGVWAVALRYFNPVGAHVSGRLGEAPVGIPNNLMPYLCHVAAGRLPELAVFGNDYPTRDGTAIRDYIHVVDLAQGHLAVLKFLQQSSGMSIINLGTGSGTSVLEMLKTFERVNGLRIPHRFAPRRAGDTTETYADPALAAKLLNWHARLTLEDMCRDAWRWQQSGAAN